MKYFKNIIGIIIIFFVIFSLFTIQSCHKRVELDIKYDSIIRVVGPEGGTINFFEFSPIDTITNVAVKLEVPENSLDSFVVFNMHEFEDEALTNDLFFLGIQPYSDFLYFVPFYESFGYNEQTVNSESYHLSIDFNIPAKVTYNLVNYNVVDTARLYRIKIPRTNEWGSDDNIWVNWNYQGYPDGYDLVDLQYIINGRWTIETSYGDGNFSLDNWEEVSDYEFDTANKKVTFEINNTDYLYVMASNFISSF